MSSFILSIIADLITGATRTRLAAAEAFGTPPRTPQASRCRLIALGLFLTASILFLSAALANVIAPRGILTEVLGWSGIACLQVCVLCGIRYAVINRHVEIPA